jgi:hypothetical protein
VTDKPAESGLEPLSDCRGFRWIGQSWESCDACGRPWDEHDGLHTLREGAPPFGGTDDDWYIRPWKRNTDV